MNLRPCYAVIDLETTGFGSTDRILEIGVVLLDSNLSVESTWDTLIQPNRDIPNTFVHGISATDVVSAPTFEDVAPQLASLLNGRTPVAHNAGFEKRFLTMEFRRAGVEVNADTVIWEDTQALAKRILGCAKLEDALEAVGIVNSRPHAALADAQATAELLGVLAREDGINLATRSRLSFSPVKLSQVRTCSRTRRTRQDGHWLAGLAEKLPRQGDAHVDRYRKALAASLADLSLSASEITQLGAIAIDDGLSLDDISLIHEEFMRQMAVTAWLDGVVTAEERVELTSLAEQLGVPEGIVEQLLEAPISGNSGDGFRLRPGDRVAFTGALDLPRADWERRVTGLGLSYGSVTTKTVVLVAGNPDSMSGKAARARELLIPVVSEVGFTRLIAALEKSDEPAQITGEDADIHESAETSGVDTQSFPWLQEETHRPLSPGDVAEAWISLNPGAPLHQLSPGLLAGDDVELENSSIASAGQRWKLLHPRMLEATVFDLRSLQGVGEKRLRRLVEAVVLKALDAQEPVESTPSLEIANYDLSASLYPDDGITGGAGNDANVVAGWAALTGEPFPGTTTETLIDLFTACVGELTDVALRDERMLTIATKRWLEGATLEELGVQLGVTRERVRQLESQLKDAFSANSELSAATASIISKKIGHLARTESVKAKYPELWGSEHLLGSTFEQYFRALYNLWEVDGDWVHSPGWNSTVRSWIKHNMDDYSTFTLLDAAEQLGAGEEDLREWLLGDPAFFLVSDTTMAYATSHQDRAVAVLSSRQTPTSLEDIIEYFPLQPSARSVANQLSVDPRVTRVAQNMYALAEWELEEFSTISNWIARRVDASPTGTVALNDLIAEAPSLGVAENSVRAYASSADFILESGLVRRAVGVGEFIDDTPKESKNMYFRDGSWHLLLTVNYDHLRGSGFQVPRGVAGLYRVPVGGEVEVPSRLGGQFVRVNKLRQPSTSTIRRFLQDLGTQEGDRVWLSFEPERFDVTPAPTFDSSLSGLARLLNEMGLDTNLSTDVDSAMGNINLALGLNFDAPHRRSAAIFGHRGQDDFADIVRSL